MLSWNDPCMVEDIPQHNYAARNILGSLGVPVSVQAKAGSVQCLVFNAQSTTKDSQSPSQPRRA